MDGLSQPLHLDARICARQFDLPLQLVLAIIKVKSGGDVHAWLPGATPPADAGDPEAAGLVSRWGPMLVRGDDARMLGFKASFPRLCDAYLGTEYGCRWLAHLRDLHFAAYGWHSVLAAYDLGKPQLAGGLGYVTQPFINAVQRVGGFEGLDGISSRVSDEPSSAGGDAAPPAGRDA